jgi:hypothetical protein
MNIFEKTGLNYLWNQQQPVHLVQLKFIFKQNLTDQYIQNWFNQIENSSSYVITFEVVVLTPTIFLQN